jgi:hypothetical protein
LLENDRAPQKRYFDLFMILLVLASVFLLIYDVGHPLTATAALIEDFAVSVFIVEYLLRIFLLFRLFKLFRYTRSAGSMASILAEKRFEFYTLALFMSFVLLASSSAIYLFEGDLPGGKFDSFFDAVYWSMITLSTVVYGDITLQTSEGRVIAMALII